MLAGPGLQIDSEGQFDYPQIVLRNNSIAGYPNLWAAKARPNGGTDYSTDDYLNNDETIFRFFGAPYNGDASAGQEYFTAGAVGDFIASENHSSGNLGCKIVFGTVDNGTTTSTTKLEMNDDVIVNPNNENIDFVVHGDTNNDVLKVDAANEKVLFGGHVEPKTDDTYDLGSLTHQYRKMFAGDILLFGGGGTGDSSKLSFSQTNRSNDSCNIEVTRQSDGSVDMDFKTAGNTSIVGSADMTIDGGSSVISGDFNDTSDIALKENITALPDGAIATIKQLQPKSFTWKTSKDEAQDTDSGFIAQEVETVLPNDVHGEEGSKGINTLGVVAHLTKALQEAIAKIETLEQKVTDLENGN
jgi:hypothetical protein